MKRMLLAALMLTIAFGIAACNTDDATPEDQASGQTENATPDIIERTGDSAEDAEEAGGAGDTDVVTSSLGSSATVIARRPATATPTQPPDPLQPVGSDVIAGIVVPLGAELLKHTMATDTNDASADYAMADVDNETLLEWFREHMVALGWVEDEERDGALIFVHEEQMSGRHPDEARGATVFFATVEDLPEGAGSFTVIVEMPFEEDAAEDETDEEAGDETGAGDETSGDGAEDEESEDEESSSDEG
jgi:hypothetical protein